MENKGPNNFNMIPLIKPDKILDSVKIQDPNMKVNWIRVRNFSRPLNPIWSQFRNVCTVCFLIGFLVDTPYFQRVLSSKNVWTHPRLSKTDIDDNLIAATGQHELCPHRQLCLYSLNFSEIDSFLQPHDEVLCDVLLFLKASLVGVDIVNDPVIAASVVNSNLIFGLLNPLSLSSSATTPSHSFSMSSSEQQSLTPLLTVEGCQLNHWSLALLLVSSDLTNLWTFLVLPQKPFALCVDDLFVPHE